MDFKTRFLAGIKGKFYPWPREVGPIAEAPSLKDDDVAFILNEHIARKYEGREYIGGGNGNGSEADTNREPVKEARPKSRAVISRLIRALLKKRNRLRAEVEQLERETISEK